ncbi:MAG: response regulator [Terriglobales bacterium]
MQSGHFSFRILIADNEPALAGLYAELLAAHGYEVHVASGGFEALADLRQSLPDLVISDINMPGMSGLELLAILRQRFPALPLIALSGGADLDAEALVADATVHRAATGQRVMLETIAHLARTSVRLRTVRAALPWLPRQAAGERRIHCSECLRSFRLPCDDGAEVCGAHTCVCVYCGTPQNYIVGEEAA